MKVCSVADITGASGAPNLGSIPGRPVAKKVSKVRLMVRGLNRRFLRVGRKLSLVHLIFIVIILYFLLRILLPLLWTLILVVALILILKLVLENF